MTGTLHAPLPLRLIPSSESESFLGMDPGQTALPLLPHPGAFGAVRRHHTHAGVDLYCAVGTPVFAIEEGIVVAKAQFTGARGDLPSPWWNDTMMVLIEGRSGVLVYGEIAPGDGIELNDSIAAGQCIGTVVQVLKRDKGRPMSMLHLELHRPGWRRACYWERAGERPPSLRDPTPTLLRIAHA